MTKCIPLRYIELFLQRIKWLSGGPHALTPHQVYTWLRDLKFKINRDGTYNHRNSCFESGIQKQALQVHYSIVFRFGAKLSTIYDTDRPSTYSTIFKAFSQSLPSCRYMVFPHSAWRFSSVLVSVLGGFFGHCVVTSVSWTSAAKIDEHSFLMCSIPPLGWCCFATFFCVMGCIKMTPLIFAFFVVKLYESCKRLCLRQDKHDVTL